MLSFSEFIISKSALKSGDKEKISLFAKNNRTNKLIDFIKEEKIIAESILLAYISEYYNIKLFKEEKIKLSNQTAALFALEEVRRYKCLPLLKEAGLTHFAVLYPPDLAFKEKLKFKTKSKLKFYLISEAEFKAAENKIYSDYFKVDQNEILKDLPEFKNFDNQDIESIKNIVEDAPVVKLLNKILREAVSLAASDIHLEVKKEIFKIRYRIDGILKTYYKLPVRIAAAVISRIKIISAMDITVRHLPQDGKMEFEFQNLNYDIRSSIIPTIYGEKAVLRLLLRNETLLSVADLNFCSENLARFKKILDYRSGIILLSGPTGSGKTTTLFSVLNHLSGEDNNIITIENPVEYKLDLLNQIEINKAQGLTFPLVLRSILRQDPDIIMIGEIRDQETAEIAIRAAVTGHLVLSTIHTIDSVSAVYRLLEMGIPAYLLSSTLKAVISQRLLRKLCPKCRKKINLAELPPLLAEKIESENIYQAVGCSDCFQTGYQKRTAAAEVLLVTEELRTLISQQASRHQLKKAAAAAGMITLKEAALTKVRNGITTAAEMQRVIELK